jgi:hypothetical protein
MRPWVLDANLAASKFLKGFSKVYSGIRHFGFWAVVPSVLRRAELVPKPAVKLEERSPSALWVPERLRDCY